MLRYVASVLVFLLEFLVNNECLVSSVLLHALAGEWPVLFRDLPLLQLLQLLVQLLPGSYLILRFSIQLPLEDLGPTYLEWILIQVAIPFRPILGSLQLLLHLLFIGGRLLIQQGMVLLDGQGGVDLGAGRGIGSHYLK